MRTKNADTGGSLPELLVVLAVTVVLAAILLPAVIGPSDSHVSAETSAANSMILDGPVQSASSSSDRYRTGRDAEDSAVSLEAGETTVTDTVPVEPEQMVERIGLEKMKTTDISYVIP